MPSKSGDDGRIPVTEYLSTLDPDIQKIVRAARDVVRSVDPKADVRAFRHWGIWARSERGAVAIRGLRGRASVAFGRGADLEDPAGLLHGTRARSRHAHLRSVDDARSPELRALFEQELRRGPAPRLSPAQRTRVLERVRRIAMALPDVTEKLSHGAPSWFWRDKKLFAQLWDRHHDEHGYAMWCAAPSGAQNALVKTDPERFFVPPYVGHRGWLGVRLDVPQLDWGEIEGLVADAHAEVASLH